MNSKHLSDQKNKIWLWTAVTHFQPGILGWVLGDHSAATFAALWTLVMLWNCYFYVSDGNRVYPMVIPDQDHIVSKTYIMLRNFVFIILADKREVQKTRFMEFVRQVISDSVEEGAQPLVLIDSSNCVQLWEWLCNLSFSWQQKITRSCPRAKLLSLNRS
jgi:hypothetical protein